MRWEAQPRQAKFLLNVLDPDGPDEILYGGAAGGGKTESLLIACVVWCEKYPGTWVLFLRRTYPELEAKPIPRSKELIPRRVAQYQEVKHRWTFANGSVLQFGSLDKSGDEYKYQGAEFSLIAFDELTHFQEGQYLYLLSRNRTTNPEIRPKVIAATNPGGPGHAWVKKRWITPAEPEVVWEAPQTPEQAAAGLPPRRRCFIPAKVQDNQILCRADPGYIARLMELPEARRRALLDGDWDVYEGQAFDEWSREIHVVKPFPIPAWWRRWVANDPGYSDPFAWYWFAADGDGNVYVYREFARDADGEKLTYSEQAAAVVEMSYLPEPDPESGEPVPEQIDFMVTGMDAFNRHPETGKSIVDYYREGGIPWGIIQPVHGQGSRQSRAATLHEYLKPYMDENTGRMTARLKIFSTCTLLIDTLPQLVSDPNRPEQVRECSIDHYYDALTYGLCAWHAERSKEPPKPKTIIQLDKERLSRRNRDFMKRALMM